MAKASIGKATPAKVNPKPGAMTRKDEKAPAVASKKKAATGKAVTGKAMAHAAAAKKGTASSKAVADKAPILRTSSPSKKAHPPAKTAATRRAATPKTAAPEKQARKPAVKPAAMKTAAVRRPAIRPPVPTPAARRPRTAEPRKAPAAVSRKASAAPPPRPVTMPAQVFTVSHLDQNDFKANGLRAYALYRDLGIAAATGGFCQAQVIRFTSPCTSEVRKRHLHKAALQLIYVLQGWMKNEFDGHGEQMMSAGSCWLQPSGIRHTVLDYSADCEVLEIVVPANFETEELT